MISCYLHARLLGTKNDFQKWSSGIYHDGSGSSRNDGNLGLPDGQGYRNLSGRGDRNGIVMMVVVNRLRRKYGWLTFVGRGNGNVVETMLVAADPRRIVVEMCLAALLPL